MNFLVIMIAKFIENLIVNSINFYLLILSFNFLFNFFTETEYLSTIFICNKHNKKLLLYNFQVFIFFSFSLHLLQNKENLSL